MDTEDYEIIDKEECLGEHHSSDACRDVSTRNGTVCGESRAKTDACLKVTSVGEFVNIEGDSADCGNASEVCKEEVATDSEDDSGTDEETNKEFNGEAEEDSEEESEGEADEESEEESEDEAEDGLAPEATDVETEGVHLGPATPQPGAAAALRRRVQRNSGADTLYHGDAWGPLNSGEGLLTEEDPASLANSWGIMVALVAVFLAVNIPILRYMMWARPDSTTGNLIVALNAVHDFSAHRAPSPNPRLGSELALLQYQTTATERLIEARSTFKREVAAGPTRRPHRHVAREVKRALKAINHDIKAVSTCFNDLGRALHGALELDRTILLHLAEHLREAYNSLADEDAASSDVQASLLMGPVAGFESTLAHVVSSYSSAATDLAAICTDLGSKGANAGVTASDLRRMEVVAAAKSAICVPQLETLRVAKGQKGPKTDCGLPAPICHNPGMDRVLDRLLASRGLYHALLAALGANTTGLVESSLPALALPPSTPRIEERRGKPLFSFPVVFSNFITTLQLEGIID